MRIPKLLFGLMALIVLCGCEDGKQYYARYRAEGTVQLLGDDSMPFCTLDAGDTLTLYRDADWEEYENRLIVGGKVIGRDKQFDFEKMDRLVMVESGELISEKGSLKLREYWQRLRDVAPDKMKARNWFLWLFFVLLLLGMIAVTSLEKIGTEAYDRWQLTGGLAQILFSLTLCAYYIANPDESLWYITDVGFLGGLVGVIGLATMVSMIAQMWKKMRWGFDRGAFTFGALTIVAMGCFGGFIVLLVQHLFAQCGFIIWTGVILFVVTAGGGISALGEGLSSSDSGPDTVRDDNGHTLHVTQDLGGGRVQVGESVYRRGADGNYRKV